MIVTCVIPEDEDQVEEELERGDLMFVEILEFTATRRRTPWPS